LIQLDESYTRPRYLASCIFAVFFVLLGNTAANTISFAKHMLGAFDDNPNPDYRLQRFIALVCISFICLIHLFSRKMGIFVNNALAAYKVCLLLFVVVAGFACLAGAGGKDQKKTEYGAVNLKDAFADSSGSPYAYASAMLSVLYAYQGWENANYVRAAILML
jgi:amino acid transporter